MYPVKKSKVARPKLTEEEELKCKRVSDKILQDTLKRHSEVMTPELVEKCEKSIAEK
jgi:hypothetical protein